VLTEEGLRRCEELFRKYFGKYARNNADSAMPLLGAMIDAQAGRFGGRSLFSLASEWNNRHRLEV
jgi:hypothetical protein